ncbi:hypothetical protein [Achromobacter pestifer]
MECAEHAAQSLLDWVVSMQRDIPMRPSVKTCLDEMRFEDLVLHLLDLDIEEAERMASLVDGGWPFERCPERFHATLQNAIRQLHLFKLFTRTHDGEHHRGICPAAYNEATGEHQPEEMAHWRSEFRAMSPEQQMITATIIWMYRAGPDSIWLRRVPCTWKASEALHYLRDAGCLALWLQLVASYPGW